MLRKVHIKPWLITGCAWMALVVGPASIAAPTVVSTSSDGALLPVLVDAAKGKLYFTLPTADTDGNMGRYLFSQSIKSGVGSASLRIDRGMQGPTKILAFRRMGDKVAVVFENPRYRGSTDPAVAKGARDSFPFSTIAMADIISEAGGRVTVDFSSLMNTDLLNLSKELSGPAKGYRLSEKLSALDAKSVKVFPKNVEFETVQTFTADQAVRELDILAPDGRFVSFTVHSSLIALPEPGFVSRKFDIRSGSHATQAYDFSSPLGTPLLVEYANRFRLEKTDPSQPRSTVKKPIVFYIDSAAPEPIRAALADGVRWWSDAFSAAGFVDAFKVEILPDGVDPQDVRYNVVNWTNRQNRSWSYGGGVIDPRTGEIVKGVVVLGALRVRQDIAIFEGLVGTAYNNSGGRNDPIRAALARIRQLGAHEVGHALGFIHNFKASLQGRASVMDYPGPKVDIVNGQLDLGDAYDVGIGKWDKFTVDWLYGQPAPNVDPDIAAEEKATAAFRDGLLFGTDVDGRSPDLAVPGVNMWTEGLDAPADLAHSMEVRRIALANFGPQMLSAGEPLANLRRKFVPIWLFHRYSIDSIGKIVGGIHYDYAVAGDGRFAPSVVSAAEQREALDALILTLSPATLTISPNLALTLSSGTSARPDAESITETMNTAGSSVFDPLVAAQIGALMTLDSLLAPARLTRLYIQHNYDPRQIGVHELLMRLAGVIQNDADAVSRRIAQTTLLAIATAQRDPATPADVAAILDGFLKKTAQSFGNSKSSGELGYWQSSMASLLTDADRLSEEISKNSRPRPVTPAGMPIGGDTGWFDEIVSH